MPGARWLIACCAALFVWAGGLGAAEISAARYLEPTTRYDHGVLGDAVEWGALELREGAKRHVIRLSGRRVFEDLAPRLLPDGSGAIVVESDLGQGARLAIYGTTGLIAATPFIGRPHRWLAPIGAADLDGDGAVEIAYIDRPHLARTLRIWRFGGDRLTHLADVPGLSNHQIGWDHIPGGIRDCGNGPEIITASGDWRAVMATRWDGQRASATRIAAYDGPESLTHALRCD